MATIAKFYLLDAATPNAGTMPSGALRISNTGTATTGDATGARTARDATDVAGTSNPDIESTITAVADVNQQLWGHRRFVTRPLAAQSTPGGTWTFSYARSESNLNHNQAVRCVVYRWRPSDSSQSGVLQTFVGAEPTTAATEQAESIPINFPTAETLLDGDLLVFDVTTVFTQGMGTAYTEQFAYNGTTEASTTTCASFITPSAALTLSAGGAAAQVPYVNRMPPLIAQ